ncbi:Acetylornithine aminotransferase [Methyloversatilis universalis FAM5]|uniref:Acetylornithine aminotransferase n=1 Tax=Methyloversatilis universalis (strain ATCC BAA-1314 / DSM 25237 / JCM 13912 / CCUG 52030 / FAM5) TaxID=1000565 RepID=F5REU7_METUF|nr:aspartate aminotransferase family protein [Methyloversatilis universalis]EGK71428.1 Acetylornithine aminotransferase [Methyloversatilis universalis FAM5]
MTHLMNTYGRQPVAFTHGKGVRLYDEAGREYLDAVAGVAVNTLGHGHPDLVQAVSRQASELIHCSNLYRVLAQEKLSDRLAELSGMDEVFFCNSGCEANEAAIKLARLYGHQRGVELPGIIVMEHAFHGRTLATLSATGNRKVQAGFEPLTPGFHRVPFSDIAAVRAIAEHSRNIVAVLFEPVQGEGGIHAADLAYMRELRALCTEQQWLFMVDEVQCGIGRTGSWFAFQHAGIEPDVMTLAKGLGSGVPIGACLARGPAAGVFKPGTHGSTFGGNPLACAAALTTLDVVARDDLRGNAVRQGDAIRAGFREALKDVAGVKDIRGAGMMIGIELDRPCGVLVARALEAGLLINVTQDSTIRLVPPLVYSDADSRELVDRLAPLIRNFLAGA